MQLSNRPALALTLEGAKKQAAMSIQLEELKVEKELGALLNKLKNTFFERKADELYADYERLERVSRGGTLRLVSWLTFSNCSPNYSYMV